MTTKPESRWQRWRRRHKAIKAEIRRAEQERKRRYRALRDGGGQTRIRE